MEQRHRSGEGRGVAVWSWNSWKDEWSGGGKYAYFLLELYLFITVAMLGMIGRF